MFLSVSFLNYFIWFCYLNLVVFFKDKLIEEVVESKVILYVRGREKEKEEIKKGIVNRRFWWECITIN